MTEEINKGCEFQNVCIEYKDISYLKIMPICAIYELSIACHDKENKCKYYKLYKQLKRLEQSSDKLYNDLLEVVKPYLSDFTGYDENEQCFNIALAVKELLGQLEQENENLKKELATERLYSSQIEEFEESLHKLKQENEELKNILKDIDKKLEHALEEIRVIANQTIIDYATIAKNNEKLKALDIRNRMSEIQNIISETIGE